MQSQKIIRYDAEGKVIEGSGIFIGDYELPKLIKHLDPNFPKVIQRFHFDFMLPFYQIMETLYNSEGRCYLCVHDRFYLLTMVLHRMDAMHPWLFERCREIEAKPDGYLDLWAREHYKSTIITFAGIIQEIIRNPDITIGIFSHTRRVSVKFLRQIKLELETNQDLKKAFPKIFWQNPKGEAPRWSDDSGLVMKRSTNPKEATVEAWGLVDGQPTSAHFMLRVYDDVVTRESVSTPDQVFKTTEAWELSDNLGAAQEDGSAGRSWHIGTRYSYGDTYQSILDRKALIPRVYPATEDGTPDGNPVFLSPEAWEEKKLKQGMATIACQMLQNPLAGDQAMFKREFLHFAEIRPQTLNVYIMCDPASSRKKGSDSTAIAVVGIDAQRNKYLLDGYHHKMTLLERWTALRTLRRHWTVQRGVQHVSVGYERYGMRSDIEYFTERMEMDNDSFEIKELAWTSDGANSKYDRIQRLEPDFRNGRFYLIAQTKQPTSLQLKAKAEGNSYLILNPIRRVDHTGKLYNLTLNFVQQFLAYPFVLHDDLIDATSRIYDMEARPPVLINEKALIPEVYADGI